MASPLSWIRKYQKGLMAFFGIILIGIFTITLVLPNGGNIGPTKPRTEDPVVMRWKAGQLKASEISSLRFRHYQALQFLGSLMEYVAQKNNKPIQPRVEFIESIESRAPGNVQIAEEEIVERYILAKEAQQQGVVVSDDAVDEYISLLIGDEAITPAEMISVNRRANPQTEYLQVREAIRMELAAKQMRMFTVPGFNFPTNPTQAAQYYTRTSRLIDCEVLPYKVEDYLNKVTASPTVEQLQKLYAEGRNHFPDPRDTRPGFKNEQKIQLQYFVAEYQTFLTNEMNKLTDQEVQAEYDRRVQANDISIMEEVKPEENKEETPLPGDPAPPPTTQGDKKEEPQQSSSPPESSGNAPVPAQSAPETPNTSPANEPKDGLPKGGDDQKKDGNAAAGLTAATQFVSFQADQDPEKQEPGKEEKPADTPTTEPAPTPPAAVQPASPQQPSPDQPAAEQPTTQQPEVPAPANQPTAPQVPAPPVMRPKQLKDVADQIKRDLKKVAAGEALSAAIDEAQSAVSEFQSELQDWQGTPEKERGPKPTFDPAAVAKKLNLKFEQTELMTLRKFVESPVGKITHFIQGARNFAPETVAQIVAPRFAELQPFREFIFRDVFTPNGVANYIFWPTEKIDASIPTFEEARKELEKAWKLEEALKLAKADAEKAAAECNSSGKKLTEVFGDKAIPTGQFAWFSSGVGSFNYSSIPGVTAPGEEFMKTAFSLQPGKAAVAANDDRSLVYVIRMLSDDTRSTAEMMKRLTESVTPQKPYPGEINSVSRVYLGRTVNEWRNQYLDSQKIEWLNR